MPAGASYGEQLSVLFSRSIKVRRFESLSGQKFFQLFMVALVTGLFWFQRGARNTIQVRGRGHGHMAWCRLLSLHHAAVLRC